MERVKEPENKGKEGYTIQSAEEVLEDIIVDLTLLQNELNAVLERKCASLSSAQL